MSKRKRMPTFDDFCALRECDPERASRFIKEHGVACRDSKDDGTPAHWAALNPNAQVMRLFYDRGADMDAVDDLDWSVLEVILTKNADEFVADFYMMGLVVLEPGKTIDTQGVLHLGVDRATAARDVETFTDAQRFEAAAAVSHMTVLKEMLPTVGDMEKYLAVFSAARSGKFGAEALQFLLAHDAVRGIHDYYETDQLLNDTIQTHRQVYQETLIVLIESGLDTETATIENQTALEIAIGRGIASYVHFLCLAGAKLPVRFQVPPAQRFVDCAQTIAHAIENNFADRDTDVTTREIEQEYSSCGLHLIRDRAAEVCIALQALELPVLVLCEVMQCYYRMWPGVKFHHYWNIACKVRHFKLSHS